MKDTVKIALDWAVRCFGHDHTFNLPIRSLRLAEETVELCQSYGVPKDKMIELVEIVYARKVGEPAKEVGQVLMVANVLCAAAGWDPDERFLTELRRVLDKPSTHFAARNQEKVDLGLTAE